MVTVSVIQEPGNKFYICVYKYVLSYNNKSVQLNAFQMNFIYSLILVILAT